MRWGLGDVFLCWLAGLVAAVVTSIPVAGGAARGYVFGVILPAQFLAMLAALWFVSSRKGNGLVSDFGRLVPVPRDWAAVLAGLGLSWVFGLMTYELVSLADRTESQQVIVREIEGSAGLGLRVLIVLGTAVLAPVAEEMLFRGLLLRALLRRMDAGPAVFISAGVFGLAHLTDPGAWLAVPGLVALGVVFGVLAIRSGSLAQSMLVHALYNLIAVVATFLS